MMMTTDTKTDTPKKRTGRSPAGDKTKKIVSLTIDPALIDRIDSYAAVKGISRSSAIEAAIIGLLTLNSNAPQATAENRLVLSDIQPDDCLFAAPSLGAAILY
jgi:hypothetical protein